MEISQLAVDFHAALAWLLRTGSGAAMGHFSTASPGRWRRHRAGLRRRPGGREFCVFPALDRGCAWLWHFSRIRRFPTAPSVSLEPYSVGGMGLPGSLRVGNLIQKTWSIDFVEENWVRLVNSAIFRNKVRAIIGFCPPIRVTTRILSMREIITI